MSRRFTGAALHCLPGLLLALLALLRPWLEASMARHMLIELPALFCLGWLAAVQSGAGLKARLAPWNQDGVAGLLAAFLILAYWMLPVTLDRSVLDAGASLLKAASLIAAGMLVGAAWPTTHDVLKAFFVLNWAGMCLAAGILYRAMPQQLCAVYLSEQQPAAGAGLVVLSMSVLALWGMDLCSQSRNRHPPPAGFPNDPR